MWRVQSSKKIRCVFFFVIWKCFRTNVRKLCRSYVRFVATKNHTKHCCRQHKKILGHLYQHTSKTTQRVMCGQYQQLNPSCDKGQDERKSKLFCQYMRNWLTSLVDTFSWKNRFVGEGKISTPETNNCQHQGLVHHFIWMHFNLFAVHLEDASE